MNLRHRAYQQELLDDTNLPFEDIRANMQELNVINTWLGGHRISIRGLQALASSRPLHICEIGCGGGDNLLALHHWSGKHRLQAHFTGIDINASCIRFAQSKTGLPDDTNWIVSDYSTVTFTSKPDIIFSSLFCHHFTEAALVTQLQWMRDNSTIGFFINDLQRHPFAYHAIRMITRLFSSSYLVKNDAPLSVARALTLPEWKQLLQQAGLTRYRIQWQWAFRYLITYKHSYANL